MKKQNSKPKEAAKLRQKAEELLQRKDKAGLVSASVTEPDLQKLIYELEVHQIELEMQNEELVIAKVKAELAEEKYTELYDFAPSGYISLSKKGEILELNFAAARKLGNERSKLIKKHFEFFVSIDTKKTFNLFLLDVFTIKVKLSCEVIIATEGKLPIYVNIDGIVSQDNEMVHLTVVDITEHKRTSEQIRLQASIIENSPVIAAYHDKELNMIWANKAYQKATGLSLEEIKGRKCYQVWNLSKHCSGCPVITAIETGENAAYELTPDNQGHWPETQGYWLSQATPMRDAQGAIIGAIEFAIDITERKQAEQALIAKLDELERFHKLIVGREIAMVGLKKEVNNLLNKLGQENKYKIVE